MLKIVEVDGAEAQLLAYYGEDKKHVILQFLKVLPPAERRISENSPFGVYPTEMILTHEIK